MDEPKKCTSPITRQRISVETIDSCKIPHILLEAMFCLQIGGNQGNYKSYEVH